MIAIVKKIEQTVEPFFMGLPELPEKVNSFLVALLPAFALVMGLIGIIAIAGLLHLGGEAHQLKYISGFTLPSVERNFFYWAGLGMAILQSVLFLTAFPPLAAHKRKGWELLFAIALLITLGDVVQIFHEPSRGVLSAFLGTFLWDILGFYLLFQIRSAYKKEPHLNM